MRGYRSGAFTPVDVARHLIESVQRSNSLNPPMSAVTQMNASDVMKQAEESWARIKTSNALGPLDGIPVIFKESIDVLGYRTTQGTNAKVIGRVPALKDALIVERLRRAGCLIIGKSSIPKFYLVLS